MNQNQDVNQLWGTGSYAQIHCLLREIFKNLTDQVFISCHEDISGVCHLSLTFLSDNGFPYNSFEQITGNIGQNHGLSVRILTDKLGQGRDIKQHLFQHGKWNYDQPAPVLEPTLAPEPQNTLSPKERIRQMLLNYGTTRLMLDEALTTRYGYIKEVCTEGITYLNQSTEEYENLGDVVLEDLVQAVEMQIEANQKAFDKSQGF